MNMNKSDLIIITFIITGLWDIVLRWISYNYDRLPMIIKHYLPFIGHMAPYFDQHTLLAAALIAGFVGATTQTIILHIVKIPTGIVSTFYFLLISFIISALYGFIMKWSKLFPHLQIHYYDKLGLVRSLYHDGISGLIVQATLLIIIFIVNLFGF